MKTKHAVTLIAGGLAGLLAAQQASAAIALDRTRVIFNGGDKSVSMSISNENKQLPYLAQGWIEDADGKKISSPLTVLPPVQRLEPGAKSQVKVQGLPAANTLPQDRETLFYFNLREIPPKSNKPNTLQLALQTRIKLFYRPTAIAVTNPESAASWQEKLTLTKQGDGYQVNNPTPYYVTLVDASSKKGGASAPGFEPLMVPPKGSAPLKVSASALGSAPVLTYVNDYGGRPQLTFSCNAASCQAVAGSK
ncbi:fimbria/pilus periplasmic chaperone [Serratia bockelmannii]|uniref:fimbria/pilus periplasmic chaperone n=1 Tax=Serratia bockelmannii TaxID=2703793 RepID=UPI0022402D39|nr:fimbria/pilus periplasmic chaperone [Serratia bockelmannii]MCW7645964.1 fimbria/pilus periplasmic chaperone [Serratia bockelmannii]MCW7655749.1 fimbria/pilus periplasmic chaperone [Serratia bockelmannii]MCW7675534.1 fimbria/pilus periplasmic chaperone [Serratia bockelmannii]MCW7680312.1 fimbria/pilus periplasmic chaperone [Serratia bockelmannii]MCW7685088.1 fimbria/pilus periplasmic chaperone [Serratia bockelmannii]